MPGNKMLFIALGCFFDGAIAHAQCLDRSDQVMQSGLEQPAIMTSPGNVRKKQCQLLSAKQLSALLEKPGALVFLDAVESASPVFEQLLVTPIRLDALARTKLASDKTYVIVGDGTNDQALEADCGRVFSRAQPIYVLAGGLQTLADVRRKSMVDTNRQIGLSEALALNPDTSIFIGLPPQSIALAELNDLGRRTSQATNRKALKASDRTMILLDPNIAPPHKQVRWFYLKNPTTLLSDLRQIELVSLAADVPPIKPCYIQ